MGLGGAADLSGGSEEVESTSVVGAAIRCTCVIRDESELSSFTVKVIVVDDVSEKDAAWGRKCT